MSSKSTHSWQTKTLDDLCVISIGKTPYRGNPKFWDSEKKTQNVWLSIADMLNTNDKIVSDSKEYVSDTGAKLCKLVKKGTLLVSFKLTLGRLAFAGKDLLTNEAIASLVLKKDELLNEYLYYYLNFFDWNAACKGDTKVKGKTLNKAKLKALVVHFPEALPEQKRIVSILDEAFAAIEKAKQNTEKNLQNAQDLFESYLKSMFEYKNWHEETFGKVCSFVRGPFGGSLKKSIFKPEGFAVYEQQHAIYNQFTEIRYFVNKEKFNEMKRFEVKPGDLIMSCSGTMGKVAIVPEDVVTGIINQALLKISPSSKIINTFLKYWMESGDFQSKIREYSQGAAIKNVASVKILKQILIPLPAIEEQEEIVNKIESMLTESKRLETIYIQKIAALDELKQSLLTKAFRGEL